MAEFKNFEDMISAALNRAESMPDEDAQKFLRAVFEQKVAPSQWFQQRFPDPGTQYEVAQKLFGVEQVDANKMLKTGVPGLQTWEPKNFTERSFERAGGFQNPFTADNPISGALNAVSTATLPFRLPFSAAGEAIDTAGDAYTGRKQRPQPTAIGPGSVLPQTIGGVAEQGAMSIPAVWNAVWRIPGMIPRFLRTLEGNIAAGKAAAAAENARWAASNIKGALPPVGGTTSNPIPMPPSSLTPPPPIAGGSAPKPRIRIGPGGVQLISPQNISGSGREAELQKGIEEWAASPQAQDVFARLDAKIARRALKPPI